MTWKALEVVPSVWVAFAYSSSVGQQEEIPGFWLLSGSVMAIAVIWEMNWQLESRVTGEREGREAEKEGWRVSWNGRGGEKRGGEREIFHLLLYSSMGHIGGGCARLKPRASFGSPTQIPPFPGSLLFDSRAGYSFILLHLCPSWTNDTLALDAHRIMCLWLLLASGDFLNRRPWPSACLGEALLL